MITAQLCRRLAGKGLEGANTASRHVGSRFLSTETAGEALQAQAKPLDISNAALSGGGSSIAKSAMLLGQPVASTLLSTATLQRACFEQNVSCLATAVGWLRTAVLQLAGTAGRCSAGLLLLSICSSTCPRCGKPLSSLLLPGCKCVHHGAVWRLASPANAATRTPVPGCRCVHRGSSQDSVWSLPGRLEVPDCPPAGRAGYQRCEC